jgi:hypothetical protein
MTVRRVATRLPPALALLAGCNPAAAPHVAAHEVESPAASHEAASHEVALHEVESPASLVAAWSVDIGFGFEGSRSCDFPVLLVDAEDRVLFAGNAYNANSGGREHALFRGHADGRIERVTLGPKTEQAGEIVSLVLRKDRVLAATLLRNGAGLKLTSRPALGQPATERRWIAGADRAWPLSEGRWLIVDGAPSHTVTTLDWPAATLARTSQPLPDAPAHFRDVYDLATQGSRWAARGATRGEGELKTHLSVIDGETFAWSFEEAFTSTDHAFDDDGGLWISAFTYQEHWPGGLGAARFPKPPRMPADVLKALNDKPRGSPGHIIVAEERIWSLFGFALRRVGMNPDRTIHTKDITDGLMLRYTREGQLAAEIHYPATAIVWPGPLLPENHGMTAAIHVEGEVPAALRGHPDLPEGFVGATLLVHYDTRGREVWSAPLGAGERVVKKLAKTSDGYVTITLEESGRCHLSRWRLQGGGSTYRGGAR